MSDNIDDALTDDFKNMVDDAFKNNKATLHIQKGNNYGYIRCGKYKFYFHKTDWAEPYDTKVDTVSGEVTKTIIPYDGWEISME